MDLGAFSVSLSVKDIAASRAFYEKLGFVAFAGEQEKNWLIMKHGRHLIGLFQGMFEGNMLTFNPGWDQEGKAVDPYSDIRELHRAFKAKGMETSNESMDAPTGPASFYMADPDGNAILFDQHR